MPDPMKQNSPLAELRSVAKKVAAAVWQFKNGRTVGQTLYSRSKTKRLDIIPDQEILVV